GAGVRELPTEAAELRLRELGVQVDVAAVVVVALVEDDAFALGVGGSRGNVEGEDDGQHVVFLQLPHQHRPTPKVSLVPGRCTFPACCGSSSPSRSRSRAKARTRRPTTATDRTTAGPCRARATGRTKRST